MINHYKCCKINKTLGDLRKIIAGAPLGNILCNIFLNENFFLKGSTLGNYADNNVLHGYNKNLETVIRYLRQKFSILSNWFYDNYIVVNPGKCLFMLFGVKAKQQFDLICNDATRKYSSHEKFQIQLLMINFPLMSISIIPAKQLTKTPRSQQNKSIYETKPKRIIFVILVVLIVIIFIVPHIRMFCSKKSTEKINAAHERFLRIAKNISPTIHKFSYNRSS